MKFKIVDFIFINFTFFIIIVGGLMNLIEPYLPILIRQSFRYGKISYNGEKKNEFVTKLEVPKSWFKHFYVFAFVWTLIGFILISQCSITLTPTYNIVIRFLDFIAGEKSRDIQIDSTSALCAIFLLFLQCCRRFYETHFMQIFSSNSKINLSHYIVGYFHYFGAVLAILMNTEGFVQGSTPSPINFSTFSFYKIGFVMFFLYCWFHQYSSNRILVNLRKNHNGKIVTEEHLLPKGGYFDYVSSPHLLFEILIYIGLAGIIPNCVSWKYALTWVAVNQIQTAWLTHKWYKSHFKHYPKERKALIPYVL